MGERPGEELPGWPRELGLRAAGGADPANLTEVRRAIEVERRVQTRKYPVHVRSAACVDREGDLWELDVAMTEPGSLRSWEGASIWADVTHGHLWAGEVVDAGPRGRRILVEAGGEEPAIGPASARPFDFLRAPFALTSHRRYERLRKTYAGLLDAAAGRTTGQPRLRSDLGPWGWSWALVWGPPGTGKTHTLVERVREILHRPDERVLVLSTTNRATDEVALRLGSNEGRAVRVGRADLRRYREAGATALLATSEPLLLAIEAAQRQLAEARTPYERAHLRQILARLRRGQPTLRSLLADAEPACVVTTLHSALSALVSAECDPFHDHERAPFTTVVLDEAGLVPRATAAAAALLAARQVVLVGDPRQLSPICVASRSLEPRVKRWLAVSGLEEVQRDDPHVEVLEVQHRMHPQIRAVVSALQYDGRLRDAPAIPERGWPEGGRLRGQERAIWVVLDRLPDSNPLDACAERLPPRSWGRPLSLQVLDSLLDAYPELRASSGLVLSPYRGQMELARKVLDGRGAERWQASTIHAQQGAQAQVVAFDVVRTGGWAIPEWKRLANVAISRAEQMVLVFATEAEMGQPWLRALRDGLTPMIVRGGRLRRLEDRQQGLFAPPTVSSDRPSPGPDVPDARLPAGPTRSPAGGLETALPETALPEAAVPEAAVPGAPRSPRPPSRDPASLGVQIAWQRAARRTLTRSQAQLVRRDLKDLGPRVVRGVAGSGKTIVLARWAAGELRTWPDKQAVILYGNSALRPHLADLLHKSWRVVVDGALPYPQERVHLVHIARLLADLLAERGLPRPTDPFALDAHVAALKDHPVQPRFDLLYIDEAQDLGHDVLAFVLSLVRQADDEFPARIFYDNAQNVYGRSTPTWADFGLDVRGRSTVLRESFRSTRQAMELALNVVDRLQPLDQEPELRELIQPRTGPPLLSREPDGWWRADYCVVRGEHPTVHLHRDGQQELDSLADDVAEWLADGVEPRDVRVLACSEKHGRLVAERLVAAGLPCRFASRNDFEPREDRVIVTTPHSFKGYEAELVAVVGAERFAHPEAGVLVAALYVAMTRARTRLRVSACHRGPTWAGRPIVDALEAAAELQKAH